MRMRNPDPRRIRFEENLVPAGSLSGFIWDRFGNVLGKFLNKLSEIAYDWKDWRFLLGI